MTVQFFLPLSGNRKEVGRSKSPPLRLCSGQALSLQKAQRQGRGNRERERGKAGPAPTSGFHYKHWKGTSTSVTFGRAGHTASIVFEPGLLGMPPNGSRIRRGEAPQVGVACENPSLDRKQPTSLSSYAHSRFKFY